MGMAILRKIGLIARSDDTGLGNQTRELANMLNPDKIMLIDFTDYNGNSQHPEWYNGFNVTEIKGIPSARDIIKFIKGVDIVISCETFYNTREFIPLSRQHGVITALQYNYELFDNLEKPKMPLPDILISPSLWKINDVKDRFGKKAKVVYLPPPTDPNIFENAKNTNLKNKHNKILHIAGKKAAMDRNGTNSVIEMLKYSEANYQLVIRTQTNLGIEINDSRIIVDYQNIANREDMYIGFDAMILPRRYAGLCLPMNESLFSALPVFMTNIEPNNKVLPEEWLINSNFITEFRTKTMIDVYEADPKHFAKTIDDYVNKTDQIYDKNKAVSIAAELFDPEKLKEKYIKVFND